MTTVSSGAFSTSRCLEQALVMVADALSDAPLYYGHGTDNPEDEALYLVVAVLGMDFTALDFAAPLSDQQWSTIETALRERIEQRRPVAYITQRAWFAGYEWYCDERVIIPRSPIAELIEQGFAPWREPDAVRSVLDLCCGSGCMGLAAGLYLPQAQIDLVDIDADALAVAAINQQRHGLQARTQLFQSDLLSALPLRRYDVIISNPPYVDAEDMTDLPEEYWHEPRLALVAGDDGLDLARRILTQAADFLAPDGVLILEVGNSADALAAAFPQLPFIWLEFARGGHGVCVLPASALREGFDESSRA
jgi:ribosomal protein L3 glutamine methyltransferase